MNFDNSIVKILVTQNDIDLNNPLNINNNTLEVSGTGFFIFKKLIMTCYHVVKNQISIKIIYQNNLKKKAKLKYIFPDDDIAILEINLNNSEPEYNDIELLDFEIIKNKNIQHKVYTIGYPMNSNNIIKTEGIISGFEESYIQTDAAINPGNSGGPLVIFNEKKYKIIGVNVSKLIDAENTNYVVPIYRILILLKKILQQKCLTDQIVYKKPLLLFDYQKLEQKKLLEYFLDSNLSDNYKTSQGIMITNLNEKYYLNKYFKIGDILLSINNRKIEYNGYIKFDFYPDKILIEHLGYWFNESDELTFEILSDKKISFIKIKLEIIKKNIFDIFPNYPKYYNCKNNLILSIITSDHIENLKKLKLNFIQKINLIDRIHLRQKDLFTVYLSGLENNIYTDDSLINEYPVGDIIIEINDKTFNNYEEYIQIINSDDIKKIKTINNEIFFI